MNNPKVNVVVSGHRNEYHSTYKTYILRGGIPFADQVTMPDTKYVIKYDFNLGGGAFDLNFSNADTHTVAEVTYYYIPFTADGSKYTLMNNSLVFIDAEWNGLSAREIKPEKGTLFMIASITGGLYKNGYSINVVTVPENCILEFDGGSLDNGFIVGQDTVFINVGDTDIWGENLTREGTWREKQGGNGGIPDKEYDPEHNSGLGRKTLELEGDSNVLTQEDFDQENTVYVIAYDFDLNGETIEVPEGCILAFEGGSVNNGKLVSNRTIINGTLRGDALYGIYLDSLKSPLSYNYNSIEAVTQSLEHGFTPKLMDESRKRVTQGIVVFKHNEKKYILALFEDGGFFLFDEYYNQIKYFELEEGQLSHMNDGTVCGTDILIADCLGNSTGIRRVQIADIISVSNEGRVHSDKIGLCSNETVYCIDYDNVRKEIAVCTESNGTSLKTFRMTDDGNYNYEDLQTINNLQSNFDSNVGKNTIQGILFKNGVVLFNLWATQLDGYTTCAGIIPVMLDLKTAKTDILTYPKLPFAECEVEGLCKDPDNDSIYWNIYHSWVKPDTSSSIIVKHSLDLFIKEAFNTKNGNVGTVGDGTYINVSVNVLGTIVSGSGENAVWSLDYKADGSSKYPFKTLDDAIIRGGLLGHHVRFNIAEGTYYVNSMTISTSYLHFIGTSGVTIDGHFSLWNSRITFSGIRFIGNKNNNSDIIKLGENTFLFFDGCSFDGKRQNGNTVSYVDNAIVCADSQMEIQNCYFCNLTYAIRIGSSEITRFRGISIRNCVSVFYVFTPAKLLEANVINKVTFLPNENENDENIKFLMSEENALGDSFINISIYPVQYPSLHDIIEKRFKENGAALNTNITGLVSLKMLGNGTIICKNENGVYTYRSDSGELEEGEFRVNISRGEYYFNGENFISVAKDSLIFATNNPEYLKIPTSDMTTGAMFMNETENSLNIRKSGNQFFNLISQGWARNFTGTLNECKNPGLYYFNPSGDKPDLGGSSHWYFVLNVGRIEIVQIVFQNQGTKIGFRFGYQDSQNYAFTEWSIVNRENT